MSTATNKQIMLEIQSLKSDSTIIHAKIDILLENLDKVIKKQNGQKTDDTRPHSPIVFTNDNQNDQIKIESTNDGVKFSQIPPANEYKKVSIGGYNASAQILVVSKLKKSLQ